MRCKKQRSYVDDSEIKFQSDYFVRGFKNRGF